MLIEGLKSSNAKVAVLNLPNSLDTPFFETVGPVVGQAILAAMTANPAVQGLVYQSSTTGIGLATPDDLKGNVFFKGNL